MINSNFQFQDLNGNLPPPRPPEQTREELLAGKMELMNQMDKYAKEVIKMTTKYRLANIDLIQYSCNHTLHPSTQVSFDAAKSENLETFTQTKLIPPRQEQHTTTTVTITEVFSYDLRRCQIFNGVPSGLVPDYYASWATLTTSIASQIWLFHHSCMSREKEYSMYSVYQKNIVLQRH